MFVLLNHLQRLRRANVSPEPRIRGSLALRHVDAGSCNGCEHELTAAANPTYDLQQYGLNIVASPRHADVLLVTGTVTTRMHDALLVAYHAMPEPRRVVALGNCALGIGTLGTPDALIGPVSDVLPVDLIISGCPPTPERIADALLKLIDGHLPSNESTNQAPNERAPLGS
jgi:Ni,Fe-hydrogenase III small subunit